MHQPQFIQDTKHAYRNFFVKNVILFDFYNGSFNMYAMMAYFSSCQ